jgi:MFS family permease
VLGVLHQRNVVLLLGAGLVSTLGDFFLGIALPFYVYEQTGSVLAMGALAAAGALPRLLLGSVAGVFIDRWDRRRTMIAADLARAALLLMLLAVSGADRVWLVYAVAFCQAALSVFFEPARSALLPHAVPADDLPAANALSATSRTAARLVGPVLGGALVAVFGLPGVVVLDSVSFLVSALMVVLIAVPGSRAASPALSTLERGDRTADTGNVAAEAADRWVV